MTRRILYAVLTTVLFIILIRCSNNSPVTSKIQPGDPFKNTVVSSQSFDLDGKQDTVLQGENGTTIVFPKGCFKDANGKTILDNIKIELAEALSLEEMLLSNLTTTSDGKLLETDGMIYLNATSNGEQLSVNKENPIHIEIPTFNKKPGMMAYRGIRDEKGNMNWIEPKKIDNYLTIVDIDSLDFLPEGFQVEVDNGMPYKKYTKSTRILTDSLYYSLTEGKESSSKGFVSIDLNEPYYNRNNKIENGKYSTRPDSTGKEKNEGIETDLSPKRTCGIDPSIIKIIKSKKYQNTLIATKEFEERLKAIFRICDNSVLEIYIKNLDKNLYELDSMAAIYCEENKHYEGYHIFYDFSKQRLTKVKEADKYAVLLKGYYEKQFPRIKSAIEKEKAKAMKALDKQNDEAQKVVDDYKKLLWKREKHRMKTYGFNWTETGWINVDNGTLPKDWGSLPLEVKVENGKQFDQVYTYVIYSSIKSLYRLNTTDNEQFYVGDIDNKEMLMPKQQYGVVISIAYLDGAPSLAVKNFETGTESKLSLTLSPSTMKKVKEAIIAYDQYSKENKISYDLKIMAKLYEEKQRQKALLKEREFIQKLWNRAYPCCAESK